MQKVRLQPERDNNPAPQDVYNKAIRKQPKRLFKMALLWALYSRKAITHAAML